MSQADGLAQHVPPGRVAWLPWLCASAVALLAFTVITWLMFTSAELNQLDRDWAVACKKHAETHDGLREFLRRYFTHLGGTVFLAIVATAGTLAMAARQHWLLALTWVLAAGGGGLLNYEIKAVIDRPRPGPELRDPNLRVRHDSFPSGHAMGSTIGYGMCLYAGFVFIRRRGVRIALVIATIVLVGLIGFSRIYLRAHWFSDILGGYALGSAWLLFSLALGRWLAERRSRHAPRDECSRGA